MKFLYLFSFSIFYSITTPLFAISHHPQEFLRSIQGKADEGQQIVMHFCASCHAENPLIPLGAPRMQIASDWVMRNKGGIERLFKHTQQGFNAMPARGGCFECTDEQLMLAILEMLPKTLKNHYPQRDKVIKSTKSKKNDIKTKFFLFPPDNLKKIKEEITNEKTISHWIVIYIGCILCVYG